MQFAAGTASVCWVQTVAAFVLATTVSRAAGLIETFSTSYLDLLAATQRYASAMVFRMNSRKVAVHAADQFDRAARSTLGDEAVRTAEKLFGGAVAAADEALGRAGFATSAAIGYAELRGLFFNMCLLTSSACAPPLSPRCALPMLQRRRWRRELAASAMRRRAAALPLRAVTHALVRLARLHARAS